MEKKFIILILFITLLLGCEKNYTPKPRGFFRISFPEKTYIKFDSNKFPYQFEIPQYSEILHKKNNDGLFDINISFPDNKADIHITYKKISENSGLEKLEYLLEDSRTLAYKHSIKADAIEERLFINPASKVYGTIYLIEGNAASPMQFYLTDSVKHFLRGSFYIRDIPDIDSLRPVIEFIETDIIRLIETTSWN
ncbi:MAG: gliding motility lipoprotein GldD [Mariniphaga sp.]|nr:gliding motility lipoprotein GldD [Mariniphaga sp.]